MNAIIIITTEYFYQKPFLQSRTALSLLKCSQPPVTSPVSSTRRRRSKRGATPGPPARSHAPSPRARGHARRAWCSQMDRCLSGRGLDSPESGQLFKLAGGQKIPCIHPPAQGRFNIAFFLFLEVAI